MIIYDGQAANNPAYDNGWSGGAGPGEVGNNPMGNQGQTEEEALSGGPNSEAAKKISGGPGTVSLYIQYLPGRDLGKTGGWKMAADGV